MLTPLASQPDRRPAPPFARRRARWYGRRGGGLALVALALAVMLPGFFRLSVIDRDEARFAQASRQMLESAALAPGALDPRLHGGGLAVPMLGDRPRLNKPPMIYWAQAASAWVLGGLDPARDAIWMYRVPSLLAAVGTVLLTWRLGCAMFGGGAGVLAGAGIALAPVFVWEARQARADQLLVVVTTGAMAVLWGCWRRAHAGRGVPLAWPVALWALVGVGVLVKGPITPMVVVLATLALASASGRWRWVLGLRPALGLVIVALLVAPWVAAVAGAVGLETYAATIADEVLGRSVAAKEGHAGPPGYHLVLLFALLWPASMLVGYGVARALRGARAQPMDQAGAGGWRGRASRAARAVRAVARRRPAEAFLLAWAAPSWVVFELASTKLPHYTMPLYPALALLAARALVAASRGNAPGLDRWWVRALLWAWLALGAVIVLGAAGGGAALAAADGRVAKATLAGVLAALGVACLVVAGRALRARRHVRAQLAAMAAAVPAFWALLGVGLPGAHAVDLSERIAQRLPDPADPHAPPVGLVGYHEDSMLFLTRGTARRLPDDAWRSWAADNPDALLVVQHDRTGGVAPPGAVATLQGFNYTRGRWVTVSVVPADAIAGGP